MGHKNKVLISYKPSSLKMKVPSDFEEQLNIFDKSQTDSESKEKEQIAKDQEKLFDIRRMVKEEQSRLERMAWACDRLKEETVRRLACLPNDDTMNKCEEQLKGYLKYQCFNQNLRKELDGYIENFGDSLFNTNEDDILRQYIDLHNQIEQLHKSLKSRDNLFQALQ